MKSSVTPLLFDIGTNSSPLSFSLVFILPLCSLPITAFLFCSLSSPLQNIPLKFLLCQWFIFRHVYVWQYQAQTGAKEKAWMGIWHTSGQKEKRSYFILMKLVKGDRSLSNLLSWCDFTWVCLVRSPLLTLF